MRDVRERVEEGVFASRLHENIVSAQLHAPGLERDRTGGRGHAAGGDVERAEMRGAFDVLADDLAGLAGVGWEPAPATATSSGARVMNQRRKRTPQPPANSARVRLRLMS